MFRCRTNSLQLNWRKIMCCISTRGERNIANFLLHCQIHRKYHIKEDTLDNVVLVFQQISKEGIYKYTLCGEEL